MVTETDQAVEAYIKDSIAQTYPDFRFIGEESYAGGERVELTDEPTFIVDPIDGTTNFVRSWRGHAAGNQTLTALPLTGPWPRLCEECSLEQEIDAPLLLTETLSSSAGLLQYRVHVQAGTRDRVRSSLPALRSKRRTALIRRVSITQCHLQPFPRQTLLGAGGQRRLAEPDYAPAPDAPSPGSARLAWRRRYRRRVGIGSQQGYHREEGQDVHAIGRRRQGD